MFFIIRVTAGQERIVADTLSSKAEKLKLNILSISVFEELKGYVIVEAEDEASVRALVSKERNVKGFIQKPLTESEVKNIFEEKIKKVEIEKDDIVELISGPFRGYKGRVININKEKEEITVELMDIAVPIPVNTSLDSVKLERKKER
ncbi:MAG: transcription elongation factor Spt5 [Candidatus Micrarchaeales archaeon]